MFPDKNRLPPHPDFRGTGLEDGGYRAWRDLAADPVERVIVVMKDSAAREAPLAAVFFDQLAGVAAGRKAIVVAVL